MLHFQKDKPPRTRVRTFWNPLGPSRVLREGMLSFFSLKNAQIDDTGQVEKVLSHLLPSKQSNDLGFYRKQLDRRALSRLVRAPNLPLIVNLSVFAPVFRQDGRNSTFSEKGKVAKGAVRAVFTSSIILIELLDATGICHHRVLTHNPSFTTTCRGQCPR